MQIPAMNDQSPRFYQIYLERDLIDGWNVVKEWGRVGASGKVVKEHFSDREQAENAVFASRDTQTKRGYQVVFVQGDQGPHVL
ncbi:MAG: WGR domain-containing protein [Gammaproteobacteria bacterium]|nr:WGR domain-containing protein [Gammaproteobacteria bacterium]MDH5692627.1 WGR domain-containing protein [Gammaproteobacteria bacterium]